MKTNKLLLILVMGLLFGVTTFAQESPSKQINQIKRNNMDLYAEATMESPEEALSTARELLMQQVNEYIGSKRKFNQADDVLVKNINAKCETVNMMRGTMHRMFVYVKKIDIEAIDNAMALNTSTNTTQVVVGQPIPPIPAPERPKEPVKEAEEVEIQIIEIAPATTESKGEAVGAVDIPAWQRQAIDDLLECSDINAVKAKFNRMKAEYKLKKYGTPDKCPSASQSFWVIFEHDGSVATVLGPGSSERVSFRDMRYSSLDNYKGQNALWFNFAK